MNGIRLILVLGALLIEFHEGALADTDLLTKAVSFALTGSDDSALVALDRGRCVFRINSKIIGSRQVGEIFRLNNIDPSRTSFERWSNVGGKWIAVHLHGNGPIYEYTGPYKAASDDPLLKLEQITRPRTANDWIISVYTDEEERLVRAWRFIYSHGCFGSKSAF